MRLLQKVGGNAIKLCLFWGNKFLKLCILGVFNKYVEEIYYEKLYTYFFALNSFFNNSFSWALSNFILHLDVISFLGFVLNFNQATKFFHLLYDQL